MFCNTGTVINSLLRSSSRILPVARVLGSWNRNRHYLIQRIATQTITFQRMRFLCSSTKEEEDTVDTDEFENQSPYIDIDFTAIAGDDPDKIRKLKTIQLEVDMLRQQGTKVPSQIWTKHWVHALELENSTSRKNYFKFLWSNEQKSLSHKEKRAKAHKKFLEKKAQELDGKTEITTSGPIIRSLLYNSLFFRLQNQTMKTRYNLKLLYASMFSPHIVVDCGYEPFMPKRNIALCAKQILFMWSENRDHPNPVHLAFCNLRNDSELLSLLREKLQLYDEPDFPFYHTSQSYLDLYPKEKLVYLSPHCNEELDCYNPEDIYIIGAYVDRNKCEPLSLAKAKKEGLRMAKFPLDKYLSWKLGVKSLTLNQCLAIMNDLKGTNEWNHALRHVPSRKIRQQPGNGQAHYEEYVDRMSARRLRNQYRKNVVYDLLLLETQKKKHGSPNKKNS